MSRFNLQKQTAKVAQVHPGANGAGALAELLGDTPKVSVQPVDQAPVGGSVE